MLMSDEKIYARELRGRENGELIACDERRTPMPLYQFGMKLEFTGAVPRFYTVRENYISGTNQDYPRRQTVFVDPIEQ